MKKGIEIININQSCDLNILTVKERYLITACKAPRGRNMGSSGLFILLFITEAM